MSLPRLAWWDHGGYLVASTDAFIVLVRGDWGEMGEKLEQIQREREAVTIIQGDPVPRAVKAAERVAGFHAKPSLLRG